MESDDDNTPFTKKAALAINGIVAAVSLFWASSLGLRLNAVHRLMTDKKFAETFKEGTFKHLHDAHATDYIKYTMSPENFRDIWPNTKNHFKLSFGLAKELKQQGLTWGSAWKGLTSLEKIGTILLPLLSIGYLVKSVISYSKPSRANSEVMITAPLHLAGEKSIHNLITELNEKDIPVATQTVWPDGTRTTFHGVQTGEYFERKKAAGSKSTTIQNLASPPNYGNRILTEKESKSPELVSPIR